MTSPIHYIYTITDFRNHQHPLFCYFALSSYVQSDSHQQIYNSRFFLLAGVEELTRADLMPGGLSPSGVSGIQYHYIWYLVICQYLFAKY